MPDVYTIVTELDTATQERLIGVLETRGADRQQQAMRREFLSQVTFPPSARVLDVGCGTGVLTRMLARWPDVSEVTGADPMPAFLAKAAELAKDLPNVSFCQADARNLRFEGGSFDAVTIDSTLSHMPDPEQGLGEAFRVLRPGGWLAVFDGDYATTTVSLGDHDPLHACVSMMMENSVNDRWVVRRLPALAAACGFTDIRFRSYGFVDTEGGYALTIVERGADMLQAAGRIGGELAAALKAEARQRISDGKFFGHIAYGSVVARKPS